MIYAGRVLKDERVKLTEVAKQVGLKDAWGQLILVTGRSRFAVSLRACAYGPWTRLSAVPALAAVHVSSSLSSGDPALNRFGCKHQGLGPLHGH